MKHAILGQTTVAADARLVVVFRLGALWGSRDIVALVDQRRAIVRYLIFVGGAGADRHQNDRVVIPELEIHATLKAGAFADAHLHIWDDFVRHGDQLPDLSVVETLVNRSPIRHCRARVRRTILTSERLRSPRSMPPM